MVKFEVSGRGLESTRADVVVSLLTKGEKFARLLERDAQAIVEAEVSREKFDGKKDAVLCVPLGSGATRRTVVLVGLGPKQELTAERWRGAAAVAGRQALKLNAKRVAVAPPAGTPAEISATHLRHCARSVDGVPCWVPAPPHRRKRTSRRSALHTARRRLWPRRGWKKALALGEGLSIARDLSTKSACGDDTGGACGRGASRRAATRFARANHVAPRVGTSAHGSVARGAARQRQSAVRGALDGKLRRKRARSLGVRQRSHLRFRRLQHHGSDHMLDMKMDMAAPLPSMALAATIAQLQPQVEVHGLFGAVENLTGRAYKPGDVLRTRRGTTGRDQQHRC
ncbi:MAG: M17 family peptidase N-terminal domain-containing protein [Acidobacteriota bacterium]